MRALSREGTVNGEYRPILLKNSVSAQGRKTSSDMARFDYAVLRGYRQKVPASPESSLFGSTEICWLFSLSTPCGRKNTRPGKPSFSTE
jgi:hypothetical protein